MRIILSRKGFDSASGGGPSPIVAGRPVSLPIPDNSGASRTTYAALGLGQEVAKASRGRLSAESLCHHDPMFLPDGRAILGQCGAAQTHLAGNGVREGDLFLFFGLFKAENAKPHHRIFGYLQIGERIDLSQGEPPADLLALGFPHVLALHGRNDMAYRGEGRVAAQASDALRLTVSEGPPSLWQVPAWLRETGLTYHRSAERWLPDERLQSVARGQEFVADIGSRKDARDWASQIIAAIHSGN